MLSYLLFFVEMIVLIGIYPAYQHNVRIFNYFSKKVRLKAKDIGEKEELVTQLRLEQDKNTSIFSYLQRDCSISYNKLQKMKSSSMYLSSVDYEVQYLPMLQTLRDLELSSDDIRWIIIRNPQIFFLSTEHIYEVISYLQSSSHFGKKEVLGMVVKKPLILSKTIEEIRQFLDFFLIQLKYNTLPQDQLGSLLLKKSSLWDCSAEDLSEYLDVLQSIYCLEIDDIQEMLLDRSCYLFSKDLIENIAERIEVLVSFCGAFRNIKKWKQICRACPRLLLLPPIYLQNYLNILREELRFDSMTSSEFHQFLQVSARIFYFSDLSLVRLRCRSNFGFLTGSHLNESNNHLIQENLSSKFTKRQQEQIVEEARFYESYLSHLSHRSNGDDMIHSSDVYAHISSNGSFYTDWISEIVRSSKINFLSGARNRFLRRSSNTSEDELGDFDVWKQLSPDQKRRFFLSSWFEMDSLNLTRADSLTLIASGKLLSFPLQDILRRVGLFASSLGLNATEMTHVIRYQPA